MGLLRSPWKTVLEFVLETIAPVSNSIFLPVAEVPGLCACVCVLVCGIGAHVSVSMPCVHVA